MDPTSKAPSHPAQDQPIVFVNPENEQDETVRHEEERDPHRRLDQFPSLSQNSLGSNDSKYGRCPGADRFKE